MSLDVYKRQTFYLSFCNYSLVSSDSASFTGLQNYLKLFQDETIRSSILVTFQYTILSVIFSTLVGVGLAIVVNQIKIGKSFFRVVFFVPMMLSGVVVGVLWRFLFNTDLGVINYLLEIIGLSRVNWTGGAQTAMASILIADVWQWSSYTFINTLAALEALNPEPLEAASVDAVSYTHLDVYKRQMILLFQHTGLPCVHDGLQGRILEMREQRYVRK